MNVKDLHLEKSIISGQIVSINLEKQKPSNFFDKICIAFFTLDYLLGFLN